MLGVVSGPAGVPGEAAGDAALQTVSVLQGTSGHRQRVQGVVVSPQNYSLNIIIFS